MTTIPYIPESKVRDLLDWDKTLEAVECAMKSVSENRAVQKRSIINFGKGENVLYTMVGDFEHEIYGAMACKLLAYMPRNAEEGKPTSKSNIVLLDAETGDIKAVMAGNDITEWRTAAASAVATKYLHGQNNKVLGILGAGDIGRAHAIGFQHYFKFSEVRIWNLTKQHAEKLVSELNSKGNTKVYRACNDVKECVKDADVIVTAVSGKDTIVKRDYLKKGVHVNALRVNSIYHELESDVYDGASVYVDSHEGAKSELGHLTQMGVDFKGQIGDLITNLVPSPPVEATTIFQSLGMAVEDCAVARVIYELYMDTKSA